MALQHSPQIPGDGIIWFMDGANYRCYAGTGLTASDINTATTKYSGSLVNGTTFSREGGGCFVFDGTNDYITAGDVLDQTASDISLVCWGNLPTLNSSASQVNAFIHKFGANGNYRLYVSGVSPATSGSLNYQIRNSVSTIDAISNYVGLPTVTINTWNHMVLTHSYASRAVRLYLNGTLRSSCTFGIDRGDTAATLDLGYASNNAAYLNGKIAVAMIYNRVLSADEVSLMYTSTKGRFGL
jgi:hypothetical protein